MIGLFAFVLVVVFALHGYLWKRLVRDTLRRGWARWVGTIVVVLLAISVPVTLVGVRAGKVQWLAWPGYLWVALMFYLVIVLAAVELPRLAIALILRRRQRRTTGLAASARSSATSPSLPKNPPSSTNPSAPAENLVAPHADDTTEQTERAGIDRRLLLARGAAIFAGLTAAGITGYGVKTALGPPQLDRFEFPMPKLPRRLDRTRLAVVSDIHLGPLRASHHADRIVRLINSVDADLVCIVGDLVDGTVPELGRFAEPLRDIRARHGAFFVTGNHEYYTDYRPWLDELRDLGVRTLRNERVTLDGLDLAGVNDLNGGPVGDGPNLGQALNDRDPAVPVVLMAHQPIIARFAAPYGVDLQVSGHTHGGQMAPFNLVVGLQQPVVSGFGRVDGVPVYVTNGAGFWGPPVRVGAPPQVSVIDLLAMG